VLDDLSRIKSILESLIFVSEEPVTASRLKKALSGVPGKDADRALAELVADYAAREGGIYLAEVAGGFQFRTRVENADYVRALLGQRPQKLSRPAMETLAVVAYRQPIIKPDVDKIRGSDSGGVLATLLAHRLIRILGRQNAPGKPFIYGTTKEFLEKFGLKDLSGLPSLREIEEVSGVPIEQTPIDMLPSDGEEITAEDAAAEMGVPLSEATVEDAETLAGEMEGEWGAGGHPVPPADSAGEPAGGPPPDWPDGGEAPAPDDDTGEGSA
jgi:segregation and condensation protein B